MASDPKWSKRVEQIVHKANKVLSLLKRKVSGKNKDIFLKFTQDFGSSNLGIRLPGLVTTPSQCKDIYEIEKVQRRTSQIALQKRGQEMEERCKMLKWNSSVRRRGVLQDRIQSQ